MGVALPAMARGVHAFATSWCEVLEALARRQLDARDRFVWCLSQSWQDLFLNLAVECVRFSNAESTMHGMNYARKSMILCGLSLPDDGKWQVDCSAKIFKISLGASRCILVGS